MCWNAARQFPSNNRSPAAARRFCTDELSAVLVDTPERGALLEDVSLIVSELVTNSVNAESTFTSVALSCHRGVARLTVGDDAPGLPAVKHPTTDQGNGRGLAIIEALSTSWGVDDMPDARPGKQVWAELELPPTLIVGLFCTW